ncbi:hypothetical protein OMP38_03860 [Cohnella ginsengisoli]|uniref:Glycosyl hydrolase-like 10 domain-containing protein n=1 Tax=Cohnella ginsengisoli TaxID=425004 RepID=A0A9X4QKW8_9BACL|nr:hypothetical protein [Cohnella ginsengisoli]MDG0790084.1 hypothetical protein [Cohnella ginsengisoli]
MEKQVKLFNRNEERMESWLWIELIGFDQTAADFNVDALLHEMSYKPDGMGLFLYTTDFINQHNGLEREELLQPESCSYAAHPYNVDRKRQAWSNWQLRQLVAELHKRQIKVYVSVMGYSRLFSDTSPFQEGELLKESPEIRFVSRDGQNLHITNVLKRFKDGTYYEDFFTRKLIGVLQDYDFDGIQVADGLSSPVRHLENGDYSDDMVEQFVAETKVELPSEWLRGCDDHPEAFEQRGRWIWRNKRKEWVMFHVQRWNGFYKKLTSAVHGIGREILFNNALTMEPVEALYRYGLDYRAAVEAGADGYIVEEVSAALSITSDNGTIFNPATELEERMKVRYHCSAVAMNLKAYNPDLKYLYMTNVWDTTEQFDIVHHAPTMFQRYIYTNLNLYYQGMNGLERCCNGPWFCLSDGLKRQDWDFIHQAWDTGFAANIRTILGATVIWSDQKLYPELDYYMGTRRWTSNRIMGELTYAGAQLNHIARIESLDVISGAIFVPNFHLLPRQELEQILAYRGGKRDPVRPEDRRFASSRYGGRRRKRRRQRRIVGGLRKRQAKGEACFLQSVRAPRRQAGSDGAGKERVAASIGKRKL